MSFKVGVKVGQSRREDGSFDVVLFNDGAEEGFSIEESLFIFKLVEHLLPFFFGHHQVIDIQFFHDIVVLLFVDRFIPRSVDLKCFLQLIELILENQMNLLSKVLLGLAEGTIQFQSRKMDVLASHQIYELIQRYFIFL